MNINFSSLTPKLILITAILLPLPIIFFKSGLSNSFSPPSSNVRPMQALRHGAAYFSCDKPFEKAHTQPQSSGVKSKCVLRGGKSVLEASFSGQQINPEQGKWKQSGLYLKFDESYGRRFSGNNIVIEIEASCLGCTEPVDTIFATNGYGNSGWKKLSFTDSPSVQRFKYNFQDINADQKDPIPAIVINSANVGEVSTLLIYSVSIFREPING